MKARCSIGTNEKAQKQQIERRLFMKNRTRKKYIPLVYGSDGPGDENFYCYYVEGLYNKYGLRYTDDLAYNTEPVNIHLKGKRYSRPPFAYNSYEDMMNDTKKRHIAHKATENAGNVKKEAVFLVLDLDEDGNLRSDPWDHDGYVTKHNSIFRITSDGHYDGGKTIRLTDQNRHLIFSDVKKAATYVSDNYGEWAMFHYLKNRPGAL